MPSHTADPSMTIDQALRVAMEHHRSGRLIEARGIYHQLLQAHPNNPDALHLMGVLLHQSGYVAESLRLIRQAVAVAPRVANYQNSLGNVLRTAGESDEALAAYRTALGLCPGDSDAGLNLGVTLLSLRRSAEAREALAEAVRSGPDNPMAHNWLGTALLACGEEDAAIAAYQQAIRLAPDMAGLHHNLGAVYRRRRQLDSAAAEYQAAVRLDSQFAVGWSNLGAINRDRGQLDSAISCFRMANSIQPELVAAHSNLIYSMYFDPAADGRSIQLEQDRFNARHAQRLLDASQPHRRERSRNGRLKIGYVSPDFYEQAECFFICPLFEAHDRQQFEVHCYASVHSPDEVTRRQRNSVDVWHDVLGLDDEQLAKQIRADEIDILVDLTMHMRDHRLLTFARKPAPVQVSWLAYPGSTGVKAIDYRLCDALMEPPEAEDSTSSERAFRLDGCWCCYNPVVGFPPVSHLPANTTDARITFGSFNSFAKMNQSVVELWAGVMRAARESRLILLCPEGSARTSILDSFKSGGIGSERIEFVSFASRSEYLHFYDRIDVALDPFPYNGITATCDALLMGVPVLTLPGNMPASRAGLSLLSSVGLPELIATTRDDLIGRAAELAGDVPRLLHYRRTLRDRLFSSPLSDGPSFAAKVEAAYRSMWQTWIAG